MLPDAVGRDLVIGGEVLGALAGADDLEAAHPRPLHELADQRRLVAVGQRVDDAGCLGPAREQRADEGVGLDVDHDDVPAGRDRPQRVIDSRRRIPRRLDHDLDASCGDQRRGIRRSATSCRACAHPRASRAWSAASGQPAASSRRRTRFGCKVGDADDVDARRAPRLRQVERAEHAAPDHRHADRPPGDRAFLEPSQQRARPHGRIMQDETPDGQPGRGRLAGRARLRVRQVGSDPYCASMRSSSASSPWRIGPLNQR